VEADLAREVPVGNRAAGDDQVVGQPARQATPVRHVRQRLQEGSATTPTAIPTPPDVPGYRTALLRKIAEGHFHPPVPKDRPDHPPVHPTAEAGFRFGFVTHVQVEAVGRLPDAGDLPPG
jgi:hypothetical protein